jgi:uncharacterized protein (DUF2236 family)
MGRFLTAKEFVQLLALPVPFVETPLPIADRNPDPGLFGPDSVTWRVLREPLLILAGGRALLLQAAHPHVAQGAIDHSAYAQDPFGRLMRTYEWAGRVAFGTTAEAEQASAMVNSLHTKIVGELPEPHATRRVKPGSHYTARDEKLLLWVHATFVDTLLVAHDTLVGGLSTEDRDRFVREWEVVGRMMGVPARLFWKSHAQLRKYVDREVERGAAQPGDGSRLVAETILHPPLPNFLVTPFWEMLSFMTVGFIPPNLRQGYRIFWTPAHSAAFRSITLTLRMTRSGLPRRLRVAPIYDFACARVRGELAAGDRTRAA